MDKEAALLVVAKDLFLAGHERFPGKTAPEMKPIEFRYHFADEFLAFYRKIKSGVTD